MAYRQVTLKVSPPAHAAVTEVRAALSDQRLETVTYSETLLELVRHWQITARLLADARRLGATITIDPEQATMPFAPDLARLADLT